MKALLVAMQAMYEQRKHDGAEGCHVFLHEMDQLLALAKEREKLKALLDKHGVCVDCGELFSHAIHEPIASCGCCQSEWGKLTPHMEVQKELYDLDNKRPDAWVPIHPTLGPLWANCVNRLTADIPYTYPIRAVLLGNELARGKES